MENKIKSIFAALIIIGVLTVVFKYAHLAPAANYTKMWGISAASKKDFDLAQIKVGKQANMAGVFTGWNDDFPANYAIQNKTLVIFWEQYGTTLDQIISGQSDQYIKQFAQSAKEYGGPVILAPLHEMNGNWDPWDGAYPGNTPQKVAQAFRHIHDVFGPAENVKWGFAPNSQSVPDTAENAIANYYPGGNYVDYVGVDGFNFGNPWQSYNEIFSDPVLQLKTYQKPILIFSMGCAEGSKKAEWVADALEKINLDSEMAGFIWFNFNKEKNWLLDSDQQSLQAFQRGVE